MFEVRDNPEQLPNWEAAARREQVDLSVRDPDEWFESVQATILPFLAARGKHPAPHVNAIAEMGHQTVAVQVFDDRMTERDYAIKVFKQHVAAVQERLPRAGF